MQDVLAGKVSGSRPPPPRPAAPPSAAAAAASGAGSTAAGQPKAQPLVYSTTGTYQQPTKNLAADILSGDDDDNFSPFK